MHKIMVTEQTLNFCTQATKMRSMAVLSVANALNIMTTLYLQTVLSRIRGCASRLARQLTLPISSLAHSSEVRYLLIKLLFRKVISFLQMLRSDVYLQCECFSAQFYAWRIGTQHVIEVNQSRMARSFLMLYGYKFFHCLSYVKMRQHCHHCKHQAITLMGIKQIKQNERGHQTVAQPHIVFSISVFKCVNVTIY